MQSEVIAEIETHEIPTEDVELNVLTFAKPAAIAAPASSYGLIVNAEAEIPRNSPGSLEIVREAAEALRISSLRIQELENGLLELHLERPEPRRVVRRIQIGG